MSEYFEAMVAAGEPGETTTDRNSNKTSPARAVFGRAPVTTAASLRQQRPVSGSGDDDTPAPRTPTPAEVLPESPVEVLPESPAVELPESPVVVLPEWPEWPAKMFPLSFEEAVPESSDNERAVVADDDEPVTVAETTQQTPQRRFTFNVFGTPPPVAEVRPEVSQQPERLFVSPRPETAAVGSDGDASWTMSRFRGDGDSVDEEPFVEESVSPPRYLRRSERLRANRMRKTGGAETLWAVQHANTVRHSNRGTGMCLCRRCSRRHYQRMVTILDRNRGSEQPAEDVVRRDHSRSQSRRPSSRSRSHSRSRSSRSRSSRSRSRSHSGRDRYENDNRRHVRFAVDLVHRPGGRDRRERSRDHGRSPLSRHTHDYETRQNRRS